MRNIDFIDDRRKVRDDGYYIDNRIGISIRLMPDEILFLREKFRDNSIARSVPISREAVDKYNRDMAQRYQEELRKKQERIDTLEKEKREQPERVSSAPVREGKSAEGRRVSSSYSSSVSRQAAKVTTRKVDNRSNVVSSTTNRPYKVTRSNNYKGAHVKKSNKNEAFVKKVAIAGLVVVVFVSSFVGIKNNIKQDDPNRNVEVVYVDNNQRGISTETSVPIQSDMQSTIKPLIDHYADVYHVDGKLAYDTLYDLTNGFSSDDFVYEMTCDQLSCKGTPIYADSYEELVIYFMRIMSQDPERYGKEATYENLDYKSSTNYNQLIAHYCSVMREDPCLIYGIMAAETSFRSNELLSMNNPGGIMLNGTLWRFPTLEAGLIETIAQVKSYRLNKGANTIEDMGRIHCPVGVSGDPHNLNANWIPNVREKYAEAYEHQLQYFGEKMVDHSMLEAGLGY